MLKISKDFGFQLIVIVFLGFFGYFYWFKDFYGMSLMSLVSGLLSNITLVVLLIALFNKNFNDNKKSKNFLYGGLIIHLFINLRYILRTISFIQSETLLTFMFFIFITLFIFLVFSLNLKKRKNLTILLIYFGFIVLFFTFMYLSEILVYTYMVKNKYQSILFVLVIAISDLLYEFLEHSYVPSADKLLVLKKQYELGQLSEEKYNFFVSEHNRYYNEGGDE